MRSSMKLHSAYMQVHSGPAMGHGKSARAQLVLAWHNVAMPACGIGWAQSTTSTMPV